MDQRHKNKSQHLKTPKRKQRGKNLNDLEVDKNLLNTTQKVLIIKEKNQ